MRPIFALTTTAIFGLLMLGGCNRATDSTTQSDAPETIIDSTAVNFANAKCPIMGGTPNPELAAEYQQETIGFCCAGCPEKWEALSDADKAERFSKVSKPALEGSAGDDDHNEQAAGDPGEQS